MASNRSYKNKMEHIEAILSFGQMELLETILQAEVENIVTGSNNTNDIQDLEDMALSLGVCLDTSVDSLEHVE
jgi:hypothetical protein